MLLVLVGFGWLLLLGFFFFNLGNADMEKKVLIP